MFKQFDEINPPKLQKVLINVVQIIYSQYRDKLIMASAFKVEEIKIPATMNYGFKTRILSDHKIDADVTKIQFKQPDYDDQKGQKYILIQLERGQEKHCVSAVLNGFVTNEQNYFMQTVCQPTDYLNLDQPQGRQISIWNQDDDALITERLELDQLKEIICIYPNQESGKAPNANQKNWTRSILKQPLAPGMQLVFSQIEQSSFHNVYYPAIMAQIQLAQGHQKSPTFQLLVDYFPTDEKSWFRDYSNLHQVWDLLETVHNPLKIAAGQDYLQVYASAIKTTSQLEQLFKPNYQNFFLNLNHPASEINFYLINLIPNSANDAEGSLQATFSFQWKNDATHKRHRRNFVLYGFKILNSDDLN